MKSYIFFVQIGLILLLSVSAQGEPPPKQQWVARYNGPYNNWDEATAIAVDNVGNVYVTGYSEAEDTGTGLINYNYLTIKYGPNGSPLWISRYNNPDCNCEAATDLAVDNQGNVYVTGLAYDPNTWWGYDTIKYDHNGNELWVARYDKVHSIASVSYDPALAVDCLGNVYVCGHTRSGIYDFTTIKYDPNGNEIWVKFFGEPPYSRDNYGRALAVIVDNYGNIYVTGFRESGSHWYYATVKYDTNGTTIWKNSYEDGMAIDITIDNYGNVYITGWSYGGIETDQDYATIKYDPNGNQRWVVRYNGPGNSEDRAEAIAVDGSGNVYVTGSSSDNNTYSDYSTIKYDTNGNEIWVRCCKVGTVPYALTVDKFGNVYVTGQGRTNDDPYGESFDYVTIKYDHNGDDLWMVRYDNPTNSLDEACDLAIDERGSIYVTGKSSNIGTYFDYATIKYTQHDYCLEPIGSDLNCDCKVSFLDFAIFAETWLGGSDFEQLAVLANKWLQCNFALEEDCW